MGEKEKDRKKEGERERVVETGRRKRGAFFCDAAGKAVSQVRNATKYPIREFAGSFSSARASERTASAVASSTRRKGWLRTDVRADERGKVKRSELPSVLGAFRPAFARIE